MGGGFRGGGATMGGGFRGGGVVAGGGFRGGAVGGWGAVGGFRGVGFRGVGFRGVGFRGGCGWGGFCGGFGFGFGWPYYGGGYYAGYPYYGYSDPYYGADYSYADPGSYPASYPAYASQPSTVNVVYPPAQPPVYVDHANPVIHEYDQYGQQVSGPDSYTAGGASNSGSSPIYLIATKDHTIQAVLSYSTNGSVLQYTTLDHQQRTVPISQVDRDLTLRLNRERHVSFQMPQ